MTDDEDFTITLALRDWRAIILDLQHAPTSALRALAEEIADYLPEPVSPQQLRIPRGPLSGADVRGVLMRYPEGLTLTEMATELDASKAEIRKFVQPMLLGGQITEARVGRAPVYAFVKPAGDSSARPTRVPPERDRPAFTEAKATGMPVRIVTERKNRKARSTPGSRQKIKNRDAAYERQQEATRKRMEAQMAAKPKEPKWQRKKRAG